MRITGLLIVVAMFVFGCGSSDSSEKAAGGSTDLVPAAGGSTDLVPAAGGSTDLVPAAGGSSARGGVSAAGGSTARGGISAAGGSTARGGVSAAGGSTAVGGVSAAGGSTAMGGVSAAGGNTARGGVSAAGGSSAKGGVSAAGGVPATGGIQGVAGSQGTGTVIPIAPGAPGNPEGKAPIPADAKLEDVSKPTTVVGTGTAESCTGDAFVAAVAKGGVITFNCGPSMATIKLTQPAKIVNDKGPKIVIDGGGKVTLSGENVTRILYMNTCDEKQVWTTTRCDNQETPQLSVQNLIFANGNSKTETKYDGGGAIYASGGRFKVINSRFVNNVCVDTGPDVGGGAIRVFQQYQGLPAYVVNCTFGGAEGLGNICSNGGGLSSIGVSWTVLNSIISYNQAIGNGGNPSQAGTPGGGSGGGIYNDGNKMTLTVAGTRIEYNKVNAYGSAIFFVSNDHTGNIVIDSSIITNNIGGSWYPKYKQISHHEDTPITVTNSTIQ
jgi:hypothetical protein